MYNILVYVCVCVVFLSVPLITITYTKYLSTEDTNVP